ncbi:large conductance mechanosensitive channel protein MscL [Jiangella sp. DSM 45060]|uniref:large conductance mechanosensitive channel protein MscL n=1 Tax=Jiangella sp. DSM 45060 TaxID=1798224 RepID=UPI00087BBAD9|nr:large conductance mechanosensitive channel protein MscL [Jiangella sp. DSM 45060]SDT61595.1 large conductance mechanosensitive channel [Jiangella sp. DSM 45060]
MLKGFRDFISRGSVVELAVAVVIGAAFTAIVNALVEGFINPLIAASFGEPDLTAVGNFTINEAHFSIGLILAAIFNFLCVAAAIYFFIVVPINKMREMRAKEPEGEEEIEPEEQILLLREIRDALRDRV